LYLPQGQKLAKVLDGLETILERGEWDTNCAGNFEAVRGGLSMARSTSNGYADLCAAPVAFGQPLPACKARTA